MAEVYSRIDALVQYGVLLKSSFALLALCSVRLFALAIVFPPLGDQGLQGAVRTGLILMIGFFVSWGQPLALVENQSVGMLAVLAMKEGVLGVMLGFAASIVFWIAEAVGALIDNQAGFNNVQQSNPSTGQESTPTGNLLAQLAQASFWMLGGLAVLIDLLFHSYALWPIARVVPDWTAVVQVFLQSQLTHLMSATMTLAAPLVIILLLIDIGFGLIGKAAEKLEPNSLAQPVKGAVALLTLSLLVSLFFQQARPMLSLQHLKQEMSGWLSAASPKRP
jgi:type III secretion protein T